MGHNPPRPTSLDQKAIARISDDVAKAKAQSRSRRWQDLDDLARQIRKRALAGKPVVLSPSTAVLVANALEMKR